ncbi:MAG TPA: peptide-methionine (S)-S-oxide reductase, partial [Acidimicrobiales bacterium]|nr:peptide-methionine (S)-S-oxide reductase [Acidimicrobiales bacterium]
NDVGTQYRSAIFTTSPRQHEVALRARDAFAKRLADAGHGVPTTEVVDAGAFYYAEDYHQQYLVANPNGYCGLGGTGVSCPVGVFASE